jgi:putative endopeptidase
MAFQVGYPEKWRQYDLAITRDHHLANLMAARELDLHYDLDHVGKPVNRGRWRMTAPTVNAYYSASLNQMMFPAGILQLPFFEKSRPVAVNFGGIGVVMGHELTHGFDDKGAKYDGDGNLKDWWSAATGQQFQARTQCVVNQYGAYEPLPGQPLNGKLTTGENIADIGGVKLAFSAYRAARAGQRPILADGFNEDQMFFIAFAQVWCEKMKPEEQAMRIKTDPHSPGRFRVIGALSDTSQFAEAFQCKPGAPMRPAQRCAVW